MSNKVYKNLYLIFNGIFLLLGVVALFMADGGFSQLILYANENSHNLLDDIFHMILTIIYAYSLIRSLLNIINKKKYSTRWKTIFCKVISILLLVISLLAWISIGTDYINFMNINLYDVQTYLFYTGLIITVISIVLSLNFLFKSKKEKFNIKDIIPLLLILLFIILIIVIVINCPKHNSNSIYYDHNIVILLYYTNFILIPIQLVNLYNLFNLKKIKKQNIKVPNMIEIKNVILGLLILYVAIFSGLFIKQSYQYNKKMNQEINFETKDYYEDFVKESRSKLREYRTLSTTSEQLTCLNEVEKMIDISYNNQHPKAKTYIELMDEYYGYNKIDDGQYNYFNVLKVCEFRENNIDTTEINKKYMGNLAIIDEDYMKSLMSYQINIKFEGFMGVFLYAPIDTLKEKTDQTLRGRVINNEIELIELVLEAVGDGYEQ